MAIFVLERESESEELSETDGGDKETNGGSDAEVVEEMVEETGPVIEGWTGIGSVGGRTRI